jgi:hypothetical protein
LSKILIAAALIVAALAVGKQNHVFERAGVVHKCNTVAAPIGATQEGSWQACSQGLLDGYPNLSMESCEWAGRNAGREIWRCPAEIAGGYQSS